MDRQVGMPGEQLVHEALEIGRQVLNDDECQAAVGRHVIEELFQGFEAAGRSSERDHEKLARGGRGQPFG